MDDTATAASDQLRDGHLQAEQAIRSLHDEWFDASAAKDLDRSMANRMADRPPDGSEAVTWSRGTRVFQRSGGRWLMTHQHVSSPIDATTGLAATELTP